MLRFTIRDVLLLTVVVAVGVGWWTDRKTMKKEREALGQQRQAIEKERAVHRAEMEHDLSMLQVVKKSNDSRMQKLTNEMRAMQTEFIAERATDAERERAKRKSAELGAPQPAPLPPGYGETPNGP